ncbi:MAG: hypothetical protein R2809_03580 [Flavobacteriales bacterium]
MKRYTSTLFLTLFSVVLLSSCQKEFIEPEKLIEEPTPEYIPDSLRVNFIWVAPHNPASPMIGARLEMRDMTDSLLMVGLDVMSSQDTVFQWYEPVGIKKDSYYFKLKSPTGLVLDSCAIDFKDALGYDEWIIHKDNFSYYIQLTWIDESDVTITED